MSDITKEDEITQEEALRQADALVGEALRETEARCGVLAQYIGDYPRKGSKTAAWSEAARELSALHTRRSGLLRRRDLIRQALDCPVRESPAKSPLTPAPDPAKRQVQVQVWRRLGAAAIPALSGHARPVHLT